jgi:hypothetical protein
VGSRQSRRRSGYVLEDRGNLRGSKFELLLSRTQQSGLARFRLHARSVKSSENFTDATNVLLRISQNHQVAERVARAAKGHLASSILNRGSHFSWLCPIR